MKDEKGRPWYPFYVGDYDRKTAHLSMLEHGAYRLLLDHYYATRQPLPDNPKELYRICRAHTPSERKAVLSATEKFFTKNGDCLRSKKCDREIAKMLKYSETQSANAQRRHSDGTATAESKKKDKNMLRGQHDFGTEICRSDSNNNLENNDSQSAIAVPARASTTITVGEGSKKEPSPTTPLPPKVSKMPFESLPLDWHSWASQEMRWPGEIIADVWQQFLDYWRDGKGAKTKREEWSATWRNWCRKENLNSKGKSYGEPKKSTVDAIREATLRARAAREQASAEPA